MLKSIMVSVVNSEILITFTKIIHYLIFTKKKITAY